MVLGCVPCLYYFHTVTFSGNIKLIKEHHKCVAFPSDVILSCCLKSCLLTFLCLICIASEEMDSSQDMYDIFLKVLLLDLAVHVLDIHFAL